MRPVLFLVFAAFGAFSLYVMWEIGYFGIWQGAMANLGSWQLLVDFIVLSGLSLAWMVGDARRSGRTVWPFALITLTAGSFGPLMYLLLAPRAADARRGREAAA